MSQAPTFQVPPDVTALDPASGRRAICVQAEAELKRSSFRSLHAVSCEYEDGVLRLRGRLPSFFLKQLAQTLVARQLNGTARIDNRVEVKAG